MMKLGRHPAPRSTSASIDDVVVFPWLPATAIVRRVATMRAERDRASEDRDPAPACLDDLGVRAGDRGRDDDGVGVARAR